MTIDVSNLVFSYSGNLQNAVLRIDSWHVARGQKLFLYGPSGSGKSTLLNVLAGIVRPQEGSVRLLDQSFSELSARKRDQFRARHIGVVFQQFNLVPYLSVLENIFLAAHFAKKTKAEVEQRANEFLRRLALEPSLMMQRADSLSVGQQQRVAIVRALINQPEILIADEPTSALDSDSRDQFIQLLLDCVSESETTLVFVSHDKSLMPHFSDSLDLAVLNQCEPRDVA